MVSLLMAIYDTVKFISVVLFKLAVAGVIILLPYAIVGLVEHAVDYFLK